MRLGYSTVFSVHWHAKTALQTNSLTTEIMKYWPKFTGRRLKASRIGTKLICLVTEECAARTLNDIDQYYPQRLAFCSKQNLNCPKQGIAFRWTKMSRAFNPPKPRLLYIRNVCNTSIIIQSRSHLNKSISLVFNNRMLIQEKKDNLFTLQTKGWLIKNKQKAFFHEDLSFFNRISVI